MKETTVSRRDPVAEREEKILGIIETTRAKQAKFRDQHVTMSHGAGGKATQGMIEGLFVPAFASESPTALGDSGALEIDGAQLAMTTDTCTSSQLLYPFLPSRRPTWTPCSPTCAGPCSPRPRRSPGCVPRPSRRGARS